MEKEIKPFLSTVLINYDLDDLIEGCINNITEKRMQMEYIVFLFFFFYFFSLFFIDQKKKKKKQI